MGIFILLLAVLGCGIISRQIAQLRGWPRNSIRRLAVYGLLSGTVGYVFINYLDGDPDEQVSLVFLAMAIVGATLALWIFHDIIDRGSKKPKDPDDPEVRRVRWPSNSK